MPYAPIPDGLYLVRLLWPPLCLWHPAWDQTRRTHRAGWKQGQPQAAPLHPLCHHSRKTEAASRALLSPNAGPQAPEGQGEEGTTSASPTPALAEGQAAEAETEPS